MTYSPYQPVAPGPFSADPSAGTQDRRGLSGAAVVAIVLTGFQLLLAIGFQIAFMAMLRSDISGSPSTFSMIHWWVALVVWIGVVVAGVLALKRPGPSQIAGASCLGAGGFGLASIAINLGVAVLFG